MILGDLGADVIKVERAGGGDETRGWGPPFDERGESAYFLSCNRNKRSVALDLTRAADRGVVERLMAEADVVVENFLPGALGRMGFDPDAMVARHPRLLWCTITGFGAGSMRPGYDFVVQAESGWMAITGEPAGSPSKVGVALADVMTGKDAAIQLLAALAGGRRGERRLTVSLQHSAVSALVNVAQNVLVSGRDAARWGNAHPNLCPYQLFEAFDRPIVIAVGSDAQWRACAAALALSPLGEDARLATNAGRLAHRDEVVSAIARQLPTRPAAAWLERLSAAGVPCGEVRSVLEALQSVDASAVTGVAPLAPATVRRPPPRLDEHGAEIRRDGWG